uniref:Uncharacterized protein n=1 Tax=Chaetoceros debilis TaxID=122233 RepID=A0A7S3QAM8_9STRA
MSENMWPDLDMIVMDIDEYEIMQQEIFDVVPSNDFLEMELQQKQDSLDLNGDFFDTEMCMNEDPHQQKITTCSMEDPMKQHTCQLNYVSDHESLETVPSAADPDIINSTITFAVHRSAPCPYFPSILSSELEERMEQSISRLAMSMKRSEMSRQRILENGAFKITASVLGVSLI